jgi:Uri superfamily endonuclease
LSDELTPMKGIYSILVKLDKPASLETRSGRIFTLKKGFYGYVGSALGGIEKRIDRHLNIEKKHYWHIDFLLDYARIEKVICAETDQDKECLVAQALSRSLPSVSGFGCSDCRCFSHLFFSDKLAILKSLTISAFHQQGLCPLILFG